MKLFIQKLQPYYLTFLLLEAAVRCFIGIKEMANLNQGIWSLSQAMLLGVIMDIAAFSYIAPLLILLFIAIPKRWNTRYVYSSIYIIFLFIMLLTAVGQLLFWDELTSRYNFIAVDYLIYMDEVMGNIRETYPVPTILVTISFIAASLGYLYYSYISSQMLVATRKQLWKTFAITAILALGSFVTISQETSEVFSNRYENELAKNGLFSLFSAFRNNELSYDDFYIKEEKEIALSNLRENLSYDGYNFIDKGITRHITSNGTEIHPNIILITVESLSADYLGYFGNTENLTPNLDKIAEESLFFTDVYASGTRTVYGLTAITLSIPPIPGNAIARLPQNNGLFSLGSALNTKGYDSRFIYGGYGYFDNMNNFFSGNGYGIIDRANFNAEEISFANIWGIADADVYNRVLKEADAAHAGNKPFFHMVMTTSNHQPFTYPDEKIDIPSGKGRRGGVKYTDYAIGEFIANAKNHAWFDNTIFVIVADHTAGSSGKMELTPDRHHIPMMFYAPKLIKPQIMAKFASQIDLAPTLMGLMNMTYDSRFYGRDLMRDEGKPRAFIANYQSLGLLKPDSLTILKPAKEYAIYTKKDGQFQQEEDKEGKPLSEAINYFQNASYWRELNKAIDYK